MTALRDYATARLWFKIRKGIRYVRLYGLSRTLIKISGKRHLKKRYSALPTQREHSNHGSVGIIGCGDFAYTTIAYYLTKSYGPVVRAAMDVDIHRAASLYEAYNILYYTDQESDLLGDPELRLIFIASNHASHTEYAIKALQAGKSVHIEKPHVVNRDQLIRLCRAMATSTGKVFLGFNRPKSRIGQEIKNSLFSQKSPAMLSWFVVGHDIPQDHWYLKDEEGGRVLGNLCHWTDFVYRMVEPEDRFPITISATRSEKSYSDMAVTFAFGNGTIAVITFSVKEEPFEGIREIFSGHCGNLLIHMRDFQSLVIENVHIKKRPFQYFRDHGHKRNICASYENTLDPSHPGESLEYVWETAELFLKTKEALESGKQLIMHKFDRAYLGLEATVDTRVLEPCETVSASDRD